jgi:hypothetical protein
VKKRRERWDLEGKDVSGGGVGRQRGRINRGRPAVKRASSDTSWTEAKI